jgi:hypothetical protein
MASIDKASTPPARRGSRWRQPLFLPAAFVGAGVLVALIFGYLQATIVTGSELDTSSWNVREFWYRRDPFSGQQLTGILKEPPAAIVSGTTNFPNSYFGSPTARPARQDLIALRSGTFVTEGPANVLLTYLNGYTAEQLWPAWSTDNPVKARVLWPAARDLVDLGLYFALPEIMELAKVECSDAEFKAMVEEQMRSILEVHCEQLRIGENAEELAVAEAVLQKIKAHPASVSPD